MARLPDWEARLADYLASVLSTPHAYGTHDCALHGANAARAVTGRDFGRYWRGHYSTALGAVRVLRRRGFASLAAAFDKRFKPIPPAFAGRGDLVMADGSIGVCVGGEAMMVGDEGLVRVRRDAWSLAWRV